MNAKGLQRPNSAQAGKFNYKNMDKGTDRYPATVWAYAVSYSGAAANQKYLDNNDDTLQVVCGGTPRLCPFGLAILKDDTADGENGSFVGYGTFELPIKESDTPAVGAFLYWDDTNKYLTTTSGGGNSKAAITIDPYTSWNAGSNSNPNMNPVVSGKKWGRVELRPML